MKLRLTFDRAVLAALTVLSLALAAQNHSLRRDVRDLGARAEEAERRAVRHVGWIDANTRRIADLERAAKFPPPARVRASGIAGGTRTLPE